jgi:hypothetical protein
MTKPKKKEPDPFESLKYRGYCWAFTEPGERYTLEEFINFAKFFLCKQTKTLWKDPIWDRYTDEEILVEYFAHLFSMDKNAKLDFEVYAFSGSDVYGEDIYSWLDRKIEENQAETAKKMEEMPDKVSFSPEKNRDREE